MDLGCSFQQPNVASHGAASRTLDQFYSKFSVSFRAFSNASLRNHQLVRKARVTRKIKRITAFNDRLSSSTAPGGGFDGHLCDTKSRRFLIGKFNYVLKMSRTAVRSQCQGNDSLAYIDGNGRNVDFMENSSNEVDNSSTESLRGASPGDLNGSESVEGEEEEVDMPSVDELREVLQKALKELEVAQRNSTMFEDKAQRISEAAIALKDEAARARDDVNATLHIIQEIGNEESAAKEAIRKATMVYSLAEARLQLALESLEAEKGRIISLEASTGTDDEAESRVEVLNLLKEEEHEILVAQDDIKECKAKLDYCEVELRRVQSRKEELQKEVDRLNELAERAQMNALKAEEDVANIMLLAEQAVAFELEVAQQVNDAEIALQKAEKSLSSHVDTQETLEQQSSPTEEAFVEVEKAGQAISGDSSPETDIDLPLELRPMVGKALQDIKSDTTQNFEELYLSDDSISQTNGKLSSDSPKEAEVEVAKSKNVFQTKKQELQKDLSRDSSPLNAPKALLKKSSRFFSASFFSFTDGAEFTPATVFRGLLGSARKQLLKLIFGLLLLGAGVTFYTKRVEGNAQLLQQPDLITTSIEEVSSSAMPLVQKIRKLPRRLKRLIEMLPHQEMNEEEASLFDMLWLLLASVIFVPIFQRIPGGSPVLGYLAAGILIGPYGLSIIRHVHGTKAIAEFGVVFLLFNIGLELSVERLSSMKKYVFGLGSAQVLVTAVVVGLVAHIVSGQPGPAAIVIGNGLALSSTAVVLQVLQERGESTSRHGRATFSVLLFQDLAVVVLLILIPLISPSSSKGGVTFFFLYLFIFLFFYLSFCNN